MTLTAYTTAPEECERVFREYADVLDIYANDQIAMLRRNLGSKKERETSIRIYKEIAAEIRSIRFEGE